MKIQRYTTISDILTVPVTTWKQVVNDYIHKRRIRVLLKYHNAKVYCSRKRCSGVTTIAVVCIELYRLAKTSFLLL